MEDRIRTVATSSLLALLLILASRAAAEPEAVPQLDAKVPDDFVKHTAAGVTVAAPKDWATIPTTSPGNKLTLLDPSNRSVNLVIDDSIETNAEELVDLLPLGLKAKVPGIQIRECKLIRIGDETLVRAIYDVDSDATKLRIDQFFAFKGKRQFVLTFACRVDQYEALLPTLKQIAASFRVPAANAPASQPARVEAPKPAKPDPARPAPTDAETAEQLKKIAGLWQKSAGTPEDVLAKMTGDHATDPDGTVVLSPRQQLATPGKFAAPVAIRFVVLTDSNDFRIGHAARQIIFNWEMNKDELRVDGGPADGKHQKGVGQLPANQWVGIELIVHRDQMTLYVDGKETYRYKGDFSKVNAPVTVRSHTGTTRVKSVEVIKLPAK